MVAEKLPLGFFSVKLWAVQLKSCGPGIFYKLSGPAHGNTRESLTVRIYFAIRFRAVWCFRPPFFPEFFGGARSTLQHLADLFGIIHYTNWISRGIALHSAGVGRWEQNFPFWGKIVGFVFLECGSHFFSCGCRLGAVVDATMERSCTCAGALIGAKLNFGFTSMNGESGAAAVCLFPHRSIQTPRSGFCSWNLIVLCLVLADVVTRRSQSSSASGKVDVLKASQHFRKKQQPARRSRNRGGVDEDPFPLPRVA